MDRDTTVAADSFDHWSGVLAADPFPTYRLLRERCPAARSAMHGGFWVLSAYEGVLAVLRDPATFSSSVLSIPPQEPDATVRVPPLDQDPPVHTRYRQLLLPFFSPGRVARWEPFTRSMARRHAEVVAGRAEAEVVSSFCFPVPMLVLAELLGVDASDHAMFGGWIVKIVEQGGTDPEAAVEANREIFAYLTRLLADRRSSPRDDVLSFLLDADLEGVPLADEDRLGIATLLLIAGIDTTANTLAATLWYLGQDLRLQACLRSGAVRVETAVEEFLRYFAPVSISRIATCPATVAQATIPRGDQVLLSLPSANRDEGVFDRADAIVADRLPNPHLAFGSGVHRCLGMHIARMEMRVCLEEFLRAVPSFHLDAATPTVWKAGPIRGPKAVTLVLDRPADPDARRR